MKNNNELEQKAINTIRFLSADAVQKANSGHPGLPMGTAAIAYTIWTKHLNHNPANPDWINRDRFILSGGHGSMLLYSLLHLTGYALSMDELKNFRQWRSLTPGHPEYGHTPGVETTTGPLGQGLSNGVGMAIAEAHLAAQFNQENFDLINHYVYAIVTDGDLMEGVASEAASLAGHLQLGKLIYLYDDNRISIDGSTDIAFTEDRAARFKAYNWQVLHVKDGNNVDEIDQAIQEAKKDPRPSLIVCRTHIGYGLPTRQDTEKAHGSPPGDKELDGAKEKLGWLVEPRFLVPEDVLSHFRTALQTGKEKEDKWNDLFAEYQKKFSEQAKALKDQTANVLPEGWDKDLPEFPADEKGMASRKASGIILNALADKIPAIVGGSADLTPSNNTWINNSTGFQKDNHIGRYFHFGVREHGMGAIVNGISYHKGLIPYCATFLVFSDYMRGAVRISALSNLPSIWIYTHDSIGLGEDGPTHQPVEHLAALRAIPNLVTLRPADANEVTESWKIAVQRSNAPTALILSRQDLPTLNRSVYNSAQGTSKGAYVLADLGDKEPEIILMASGSEVSLIVEAGKKLSEKGISVRLVSFPSWELFKAQSKEYQESVLPKSIKNRLSVEAGISMGWEKWVGCEGRIISVDKYGASAPADILFEKYGLTVEKVIEEASLLLEENK